MNFEERKELIKKSEHRTPLILLRCVAELDPEEVYESSAYVALHELLRDQFKIIYTIKELNERKKREEAKARRR